VAIRTVFFNDVAPCGSCKTQRFGGAYGLDLQGINIGERRKTADANRLRHSKGEVVQVQGSGKIMRREDEIFFSVDFSALRIKAILSCKKSIL
jgi:hypothetical protein